MGQNNDMRDRGDKQGQQGGQMDKNQKSNPQESQQRRSSVLDNRKTTTPAAKTWTSRRTRTRTIRVPRGADISKHLPSLRGRVLPPLQTISFLSFAALSSSCVKERTRFSYREFFDLNVVRSCNAGRHYPVMGAGMASANWGWCSELPGSLSKTIGPTRTRTLSRLLLSFATSYQAQPGRLSSAIVSLAHSRTRSSWSRIAGPHTLARNSNILT